MRKILFTGAFALGFSNSFSQNIAVNTSGNAAAATNMFEVTQTSTAANMVALYAIHSGANAAGQTGYGFQAIKTGATGNNVAGYFSASGGANNYGIIVPSGGGSVGIGTATPLVPLHVISGANTSPLYLKSQSTYDAFSILPWSGITYLSAGIYYNNGSWVHDAATTSNALLGIQPNAGVVWYNSNNSIGSWNVASNAVQWDVSGYWKNLVQSTAAGTSYITGGNVGVGVTNPAYGLEVNGTFGFGDGAAGSYRSRTESRADAGLIASQSGFYQTAAPSPSTSWPTSTPNASSNFDASGNAANWWHLIDCRHSNNGNNYALQFSGGFFDQALYFRKTNNNASQAWSEIMTTSSNGYIRNQTTVQASANYNISGSGNVQTSFQLQGVNVLFNTGTDVYGNIRVLQNNSAVLQDGMYINYNSTGGAAADVKFYANGVTERMRILASNGNVGIGTAAPACKLQVVGRIMTDNMNQTSDVRLKKNIVTIDNALSKITSVRGVYFNWKTDIARKRDADTTLQMGLIAQEIEKIFPELVHTDNEGYKSVEYSNMVAVLIEAIKEQQKQIEKLQAGSLLSAQEIKNLKEEMSKAKAGQQFNIDQSGKMEIKPAVK